MDINKFYMFNFLKNLFTGNKDHSEDSDDERYGIQIEFAHKRAIELIPEEFFWNCYDDACPFGSDEGDTALAEFREWRRINKKSPIINCLKWVIESVGEMEFKDYNKGLLDKKLIEQQVKDENFNAQQYIDTLHISVIATGFGQLVDEGKIDLDSKPIIEIAIDRQILKAEMEIVLSRESYNEFAHNTIEYMKVLKRALVQA